MKVEAFVEQESGVFTTSRLLSYRPEEVFAAFENPETLARWWGPNGFTNTFETFELKVGGRWRFVMHGPDGANYPNESTFLDVTAPSRLVIQHLSQPHFVLTVTFAEEGGGTKINWQQVFQDRALGAKIRHIIEPANEQNLDRLEVVLAAAPNL